MLAGGGLEYVDAEKMQEQKKVSPILSSVLVKISSVAKGFSISHYLFISSVSRVTLKGLQCHSVTFPTISKKLQR